MGKPALVMRFNQLLQEGATPALREAGFKKHKTSYRRETDQGLLQIVTFRRRSGQGPGELAFSLEVGVFVPGVDMFMHGEECDPLLVTEAAACTLSFSCCLPPPPSAFHDLEWHSLVPGTEGSDARLWGELQDWLRRQVIPVLASLGDAAAIIAFLNRTGRTCAIGVVKPFVPASRGALVAVLLELLGRRELARQAIDDALASMRRAAPGREELVSLRDRLHLG
ncbi:MAG: hypothetical protein AB7N76_07420 [Planctomycetota bacterium]